MINLQLQIQSLDSQSLDSTHRNYPMTATEGWLQIKIDYSLVDQRYFIISTKIYPSADIASDQDPVVSVLHMKLKKLKKENNKLDRYQQT